LSRAEPQGSNRETDLSANPRRSAWAGVSGVRCGSKGRIAWEDAERSTVQKIEIIWFRKNSPHHPVLRIWR
jgi:hypothetical protein